MSCITNKVYGVLNATLSGLMTALFVYFGTLQAAEPNQTRTIGDIKPPFKFSILTLTPDDKPQPGVKIKCLHPRAQRGAAIVDTVATSSEKGVAGFDIAQADLVSDRYFWFSIADDSFVGTPGVGISPIDNEYTYTFKVLPAKKYQILIHDKDNRPIPGAKLWLYSDHPAFPRLEPDAFRAVTSATANAQGLADITFAAVETNIVASAKGQASKFIRGVSLSKDGPFVITLTPGCNITGRVVDAENSPVANVQLSATKKDFMMYYLQEFILKAATDAQGKFVLENATEGIYEIRSLMQEPHEALYAKPVSVTVEGNSSVSGVKILVEHGAVLKGKYVTKHKLRLAGRDIFISTFSPIRSNWEIQTKDDGSFAISGIPKNTEGMARFVGVSGYYTSAKMSNMYPFFTLENDSIRFSNVPPGVYEGMEVQFLLAGRSTGIVFDSSGTPMPNQELVIRPGGWIYRTNDKGQYTAEIPPNMDITIEVRDSSSRRVLFCCEPFRVEEGQVIEKNLNLGSVPSKLVGQPLPEFKEIGIEFDMEQAQNKKILVCFFDMNQRPSRNCIVQLAKQAECLKEKGVTALAVQAQKTAENTLREWAKINNISLPVGMVQGDDEKTRLDWGVKSLPWLILTDTDHIVRAEGFGLAELNDKITEVHR